MAEIDFYIHIYGTKDAVNVEELSSADVVECKHGEWVGYPECLKYTNAYSDDHIVCSACEECFSILDNDCERFNLNYGTYPQRNSEQRKVLFANRDNNWKCRRVVCVEDNASYRSAADASEHYHIDRSSITKCCKGKRSTAGGYHWEYDYSY